MNQAGGAYEQSVNSLIDTINFVPWEYDNYVFLPASTTSLVRPSTRSTTTQRSRSASRASGLRSSARPYESSLRVPTTARATTPKAIEQAKIAADMDPNYTDAWLFLSSLHEGAGDTAGALAILQRYETIRAPEHESILSAIKRLESSATTPPQ